ncbi:MAG: toll/interleukin-1 receptor domain-containing protein [Bacteroidaceae bacterium]|nr:toll/interleukin-1 receptor domain-containing protein [Bacteroidaceae bacterium]
MARIFISYKRIDFNIVNGIKEHIESELGEKCWIDLDGIESDAQFKDIIISAINECEIVLFMYSSAHSHITDYEKDWTVRELNFAASKNKRIVFINIDKSKLTDQFEFDFGTKQQIDGTSTSSINRLIKDLRNWLLKNGQHPEMPVLSTDKGVRVIKSSKLPIIIIAIAATVILATAVLLHITGRNGISTNYAESVSPKTTETQSLDSDRISTPDEDTVTVILETEPAIVSDELNGYGFVDLGLSVNWSTCNLGASAPQEAGTYFAWGETSGKTAYRWDNLKYHINTTTHKFYKYVDNAQFGNTDGKHVLDLADDAANAAWGKGWRLPTSAEQDELRNKCIWKWTTLNNVHGYEITSNSNGNSIFIPASGYCDETDIIGYGSDGYLWSSETSSGGRNACYLYFRDNEVAKSDIGRYLGLCIRPVCHGTARNTEP